MAHDELIDGIIHDLLEQDVTAIVIMRTIPNAANVHAGAQPDVFQRRKRFDFALVVNVLVIFGHKLAAPVSCGTE